MNTFTRLKFLKNSSRASAGAFVSMNGFDFFASPRAKSIKQNEFLATTPLPVQVVIDDVGWWSGHDGSRQQEPFRTGILRNHVPASHKYFGFDTDVLTIDRGKDVLSWDAPGVPPTGRLSGPTCGMHRSG